MHVKRAISACRKRMATHWKWIGLDGHKEMQLDFPPMSLCHHIHSDAAMLGCMPNPNIMEQSKLHRHAI